MNFHSCRFALSRGPMLALSALAMCTAVAAECPDALTVSQCRILESSGEVFHAEKINDGSKDTQGIGALWIDAPPETVWGVVTDNANFEQFICSIVESDYDPTTGINRHAVDLPVVPWNLDYSIVIQNTIEDVAGERIWRSAWTYAGGDLDLSEGAWTLYSHNGGTLVLYELRTDPGFGKRWVYSPRKAEAELGKLLGDVKARALDPGYRCP